MAFAESKCLVVEHALAEAEIVRDEALIKVVSLNFECKLLAQSIVDSVDKMLSQSFKEKKGVARRVGLVDGEISRIGEGVDVVVQGKGCSSTGFDRGEDASGQRECGGRSYGS